MKGIQLRQELMLDLLQMKEISTYKQQKNGTRIFQLPIKKYGQYIEVGSFKSGYVRRMNGGYTPYQLNKTEKFDHYYKRYDYSNNNSPKFNGTYSKHECVKRILIDNEYDRIQYLITFCLKNYYINQANLIEDGKFIPKWKHDSVCSDSYDNGYNHGYDNGSPKAEPLQNLSVTVNNERYKII